MTTDHNRLQQTTTDHNRQQTTKDRNRPQQNTTNDKRPQQATTDPILKHMNTVHNFPSHFFKINCNFIPSPRPRSSKWCISLRIHTKILSASLLHHVRHPSRSSRHHLQYYTCIENFSLRSKHLPKYEKKNRLYAEGKMAN